ncbi:MAG: YdcF family protein [Planctomycetaceae bacterium]|nr:YdcF family protein [Planctomycetaceae bacterium]
MANRSGMLRFLLFAALVGGVLLAIVWGVWGRSACEKIVTSLILPAGVIWWVAFLTALRLFQTSGRRAGMSMLLIWLLYSAGGSGYLSGYLARRLEAPYRNLQPLESKPLDAVVLLGGGGSLGGNRRMQGNGSGDRLILAAQLYHKGVTRHIICTGRRIEAMDSTGVDPADVGVTVLSDLGVPEECLEKFGGENSKEELQLLAKRFPAGTASIGLVTSAWHMPRVERLARRAGLEFIPLPADFRSAPDIQPTTIPQKIAAVIPGGDAFQQNGAFVKELIAELAGR